MCLSWIERHGKRRRSAGWILILGLFSGIGSEAATIVVPAQAGRDERAAAAELGHVWLSGTGAPAAVRSEEAPALPAETGPWFFLGDTSLARARAPLRAGLDPDGFHVLNLPDRRIVLRGASGSGTVLAVEWYAQHAMGVRWYVPGPLGEVVPALDRWAPPALDRVVAPGFVSRELSGLGERGGEGEEWARRNGLHGGLPHGHALGGIFPAALFEAHPEWFPLREGRRYRPVSPDDYNWQPNLALPEVAAHAAEETEAFFDRNPEAKGCSLSVNDSIRYDQSEATVRARGPLRWFRGRPDYSDLVFGFMNRVADDVAKRHPDKLLNAYAYYWCENAPSFPVRPNVVPWLTADRSQGYDGRFRAEDRALIRRWCHSGAKLVGIYDYLYGAPFLVPRATTRMTAASIGFAYRAGVRAYYAEAYPNWGLDGPKLWVAAQLLWNPDASIDALLDDYYRGFWGDAAAPMRRFDDGCERAWSRQPKPGWWIKFYKDEAQAELFAPALRMKLRSYLEEARARASDPAVRERVERVSKSFAVTERFAAFCEVRTALARAAGAQDLTGASIEGRVREYRLARAALAPAFERAVKAGGMGRQDLEVYLMNDPEALAAWRVRGRPEFGLADPGLKDPEWRTLASPPSLDDRTFEWSTAPWLGRGEPVEGRAIQVSRDKGGRVEVTYRGCKSERLQQWLRASPGKSYEARVRVRGRVSPGNQTFLVMSWLDRREHYVGRTVSDRLPDGDWTAGTTLLVAGRAPEGAEYVGVSACIADQTGSDFASFSDLKLCLSPETFPFLESRP